MGQIVPDFVDPQTDGPLPGLEEHWGVVTALADSGRVADAREYARAALRNYETYGGGAAEMIQHTQQLLAELDAGPQ